MKTNTRTSFVLQVQKNGQNGSAANLTSSSADITWALHVSLGKAKRKRRSTNGEEFVSVQNFNSLTATGKWISDVCSKILLKFTVYF